MMDTPRDAAHQPAGALLVGSVREWGVYSGCGCIRVRLVGDVSIARRDLIGASDLVAGAHVAFTLAYCGDLMEARHVRGVCVPHLEEVWSCIH